MDARFYNSSAIDIERLAVDLENFLRTQGYQVQHMGNNEQMMVQLKKGGDLEALIGLQAALTITMQRTSGGVIVGTGQQKWVDKAAVGIAGLAIPPLWPLMVTAGFGAVRQVELANKAMSIVDGLVHQQQPNVSTGPAPTQP
jgi:hypothetical protein